MKVTKNQLRRIIKEERAKLLNEESRERKEGRLLADFDEIISGLEDLAREMYGRDDEAAKDIELHVSRLTDFFQALEDYFTGTEVSAGFIDMTDPRKL